MRSYDVIRETERVSLPQGPPRPMWTFVLKGTHGHLALLTRFDHLVTHGLSCDHLNASRSIRGAPDILERLRG